MSTKAFRRLQNSEPRQGLRPLPDSTPAEPLGKGRPTLGVDPPTEFEHPDGAPCSGFEQLSPPIGVDPKVFQPDRKIDQVVLAMSLASNDLLSARWVLERMLRGKPTKSRLNGYDGARGGMVLWCNRLMIGVLHEILRLIREHSELLTTDPEFASALAELNKAGLKNWQQVLRVATEATRPSDEKFLALIRGNLSFHYYQPKPLAEGYRDGFGGAETESNSLAYMSLGEEFSNVRFYFADLAVRTAGQTLADKAGLGASGYEALFDDLSNMLYAVVVAFVRMRLRRLEPEDVT